MKVLIIEDDDNKRERLSQFMNEAFPKTELRVERSLQSGLQRIISERPNLVLLDMSLPNYDIGPDEPGGISHSFGGEEFLLQIERFDIAVPVVVITQFETFGEPPHTIGLKELDRKLRDEHPGVYMGAVYYQASIHGWKDELRNLIATTLRD